MSDEVPEAEIREAAERLGLSPARFRILPEDEASRVWRGVEARFVVEPRSGWWWSRFQPEPASAHYIGEASYGYRYITEVVPPDSAASWLIAGDCLDRSFVVCEGSIEDIRDVIGECFGFEYYVVPKDLDWLRCENHHDIMIAVGDAVRDRLIDMASPHPDAFNRERPG